MRCLFGCRLLGRCCLGALECRALFLGFGCHSSQADGASFTDIGFYVFLVQRCSLELAGACLADHVPIYRYAGFEPGTCARMGFTGSSKIDPCGPWQLCCGRFAPKPLASSLNGAYLRNLLTAMVQGLADSLSQALLQSCCRTPLEFDGSHACPCLGATLGMCAWCMLHHSQWNIVVRFGCSAWRCAPGRVTT